MYARLFTWFGVTRSPRLWRGLLACSGSSGVLVTTESLAGVPGHSERSSAGGARGTCRGAGTSLLTLLLHRNWLAEVEDRPHPFGSDLAQFLVGIGREGMTDRLEHRQVARRA